MGSLDGSHETAVTNRDCRSAAIVASVRGSWRALEASRVLHSVVLKNLPACPTKMLTVLLEALLDGVVAIRHLLSAKPRRIARTRAAFLWRAASGLRPCTATS
jgi:hypothetical protein